MRSFGSESDDSYKSSSDDDSTDDEAVGADGRPILMGRARWVKKEVVITKKITPLFPTTPIVQQVVISKADKKALLARPTFKVPEAALTEEELQRRLSELMNARGRKGTDPREILRKLEVLTRGARKFGPRVEIPVLMHLVSAMYDSTRGIDDYMEVQPWRTCFRCLMRITKLLESHKELSLGVMSAEDATDLFANKLSLIKKQEEAAVKPVDPNVIRVVGTLGSFIQRLEDEYTKALQQINPHTSVSIFVYFLTVL